MNKKELEKKLKEYDDAYYNHSVSLVTDYEYDQLKKEYEALVGESSIGATPTSKFRKVKHNTQMLSLGNTYSIDDVYVFMDRVMSILGSEDRNTTGLSFYVEPKLDGLSIALRYQDGVLVQAITRGDGFIGEDVTANVMAIENIPKTLAHPVTIEVRGEVVLPVHEFQRLNEDKKRLGEAPYANPRNTASGTMRLLDPMLVRERKLEIYVYDIQGNIEWVETQDQLFDWFETQKFPAMKGVLVTQKTINKYIDSCKGMKTRQGIETDGLVIKVNTFADRVILGATAKAPRWAVAYKFETEQVMTTLKYIVWQIGRTGKLTPVAELAPVEISGTKVERASLHNYSEIQRKDIRIGDKVLVEKAAEIIPQVVKPLIELRTGKELIVEKPTDCPTCHEPLTESKTGIDLYCTNEDCQEVLITRLEHFVSRDAMNIMGIGRNLIAVFVSLGMLTCLGDIYRLTDHKDKMLVLAGFGEKKIHTLLENIEKSKSASLDRVIYSLGIPNIGRTVSKKLMKHYGKTGETFPYGDVESLGLGEVITESLRNVKLNPKLLTTIEDLKRSGLSFQSYDGSKNGKFVGKTFLFTGIFYVPRRDLEGYVEDEGGKLLSSVSKSLDYLVVGEKAGSKLEKAKKLPNVTLLTEEELMNRLFSSDKGNPSDNKVSES